MIAIPTRFFDSLASNTGIFGAIFRPVQSYFRDKGPWVKTAWVAIPVLAIVSFVAIGAGSPPSIPAITLSSDPLYAPTITDKPALALAVSVEFPTVGHQYGPTSGSSDNTYTTYDTANPDGYLGYYDVESCYAYRGINSTLESLTDGAGSFSKEDFKRFVRISSAKPLAVKDTLYPQRTTRVCTYTETSGVVHDGYSGNFLNWASSSAIDMLRLSLTGGDRYVDKVSAAAAGGVPAKPAVTILQRAVLPNGDPTCMWNSNNFAGKVLTKTPTVVAGVDATSLPFFGAIPAALANSVASSQISIANTFNQIFFKDGTASGGCPTAPTTPLSTLATPSTGYDLLSKAPQVGEITVFSGTAPADVVACTTSENKICALPTDGTIKEVWYGAGSNWHVFRASYAVFCGSDLLGNPLPGTNKQCYARSPSASSATWAKDSVFFARVQVCNVGENSTPWEPSAVYPEGSTVVTAGGGVWSTVSVVGTPGGGTSGTTQPSGSGPTFQDGTITWTLQTASASTNNLKDLRDYNLCKKYPNGDWRPAGTIQKYGDQIRLAAFGYLLDQVASYSSGRYGGVLRANMKYVGSKTFDKDGIENTPGGGNTKIEWNENNGTFIANPDSNASEPVTNTEQAGRTPYLSGVVNFVNMFGRTGPKPGVYKKYDPVGELHYEALRYLQGLPPSADAISGTLTNTMKDGYFLPTWKDPYGDGRTNTQDYACVKSNIIVIGDINTHDGNRLPGVANTSDPSVLTNNIPNINYWRGIVQAFEKNQTTTQYKDGTGATRNAENPNGANGSVPTGTTNSQIMGSAYWALTHDIRGTAWTNASPTYSTGTDLQRPGLRVKTFTFDVNEYGAQNNATTRRNANQFFMASKYGGFETDPSNVTKNPYNTLGNPFRSEGSAFAVDNTVWADRDPRANRVGEANTYFRVDKSAPRTVLTAFDDIFARATTAARSIAGGAIQSKNITTAGNTIFQGTFDTSDWSGDLLAIPIDVSASNVVSIGATNRWTAATQLGLLTDPANTRKIYVGNSGATASVSAVEFKWAEIETSLKDALNKPSPSGTADSKGQDRLNYLRGDSSLEGNPFRKRKTLLGDIINSGVAYSGAPSSSVSGAGYSTFYTDNIARTTAVFVGANDGMLHAFNAKTGDELFAYIPSWMGRNLSSLTNASYGSSHQSYVDGTPAVAEALVGSAWKTVLVGGTGAGGRGVYALDVTNPAQTGTNPFDASKVMWEFTNTDDADLGNVVGRPQILKMRTSSTGGATATYKYFAAFASGVNNYTADSNNGLFSSTGEPAIFLLDLSKATGAAWQLGVNYYKLSFPVDSTLMATNATGMINFRAALGSAREVTHIFAGDLHGNVWKLDFSLVGTTDWNILKLSTFKRLVTGVSTPFPFYSARDGSGNVQPISMAPTLVFGPTPDTSYVMFGTGKYLEVSDKSSSSTQSAYLIYDNGTTTADSTTSAAIKGRSRLKVGTANVATGIVTVPAFTMGRATTDTNTDNPRTGWYFDFPVSKEREVSNATVNGAKIVFGSLIPGASVAAGSCAASGGSGNEYSVDILTGNGTIKASTTGILGEPLVGEIPNAATYSVTDSTGRRTKTPYKTVIQQGSTGLSAGATTAGTPVTVGRLSWRQINNYQDLHKP